MSGFSSAIGVPTKDNYDTWVMQIEAVMATNGTWKYVNGKVSKPTMKKGDSVEAVEKWEEEDARAKLDIIFFYV